MSTIKSVLGSFVVCPTKGDIMINVPLHSPQKYNIVLTQTLYDTLRRGMGLGILHSTTFTVHQHSGKNSWYSLIERVLLFCKSFDLLLPPKSFGCALN